MIRSALRSLQRKMWRILRRLGFEERNSEQVRLLHHTTQIIQENVGQIALRLAGPVRPEPAYPGPARASRLCTQREYLDPVYGVWCETMGEHPRWHRKQWEFVFICRTLAERGFLRPEMRGVGFGVGQEPLPAVFAKHGVAVLATDMAAEAASVAGWVETAQHANDLTNLLRNDICDERRFRELVSFRTVDMNAVPADLGQFDFCWSACSCEHLGSIEAGIQFMKTSIRHLRPGGVAIHTTEFNCSDPIRTIESGSTVLFRRSDLDRLAMEVAADGHAMEALDDDRGGLVLDQYIDLPPYLQEPHLKLLFGGYVTTSVGLVMVARQ